MDNKDRLERATALVREALGRMEWNPEGACWRLADALGELAHVFPSAGGIETPTGLGNQIQTRLSRAEASNDQTE